LLLRAGKPYETDTAERTGEYRLDVIQAVTQSSDPKVIPALIGALGTGTGVSKALARFGDVALEPLAAVARQDQPDDNAVTDALHALRYVLEAGKPISPRSRDLILVTAVERLTGRQLFLHVVAGVELAVATKNPVLRRRVEQLANDPEQVRQMGIVDSRSAAQVRDAAIAALRKQSH
jgi:hypothetical protein